MVGPQPIGRAIRQRGQCDARLGAGGENGVLPRQPGMQLGRVGAVGPRAVVQRSRGVAEGIIQAIRDAGVVRPGPLGRQVGIERRRAGHRPARLQPGSHPAWPVVPRAAARDGERLAHRVRHRLAMQAAPGHELQAGRAGGQQHAGRACVQHLPLGPGAAELVQRPARRRPVRGRGGRIRGEKQQDGKQAAVHGGLVPKAAERDASSHGRGLNT